MSPCVCCKTKCRSCVGRSISDGIDFAGEMLIVALGLDSAGIKHVLGIRQGTTENAIVCRELLTSLRDRGLEQFHQTCSGYL